MDFRLFLCFWMLTDAEAEAEESWCPPNPDAPDDPPKARSPEPLISLKL